MINDAPATTITGNIIGDSGSNYNGFITKIFNSALRFFNLFLSITGRAIDEAVLEPNVTVSIEESITNNDEIVVEYYTDAPYAEETIISENKKEITIIGSEEVHYEDILAYSELPQEVSSLGMINFYWINESSGEKYIEPFTGKDKNENGLIDTIEWIVPHLSNQSYEIDIIILNVQSYPLVGGKWNVEFTTTGTANLTIKPINGTTWDNLLADKDLKFLQIMCGENILDYEWIDNSVFIKDYYCNETGKETSLALTSGAHYLEFDFGGVKAYARNTASSTIYMDADDRTMKIDIGVCGGMQQNWDWGGGILILAGGQDCPSDKQRWYRLYESFDISSLNSAYIINASYNWYLYSLTAGSDCSDTAGNLELDYVPDYGDLGCEDMSPTIKHAYGDVMTSATAAGWKSQEITPELGNATLFNDSQFAIRWKFDGEVLAIRQHFWAIPATAWTAGRAYLTVVYELKPSAPSANTLARINATAINLTWIDNSAGAYDERNVSIERSTNGGAYALIGINTTLISYLDTTADNSTGNNYTYRINSCNLAGCSIYNLFNAGSPVVNSVIITSTSSVNDTLQNLTAVVNATDPESNNITFAYNWYKNNVLNATTLITDQLISYWSLNNDTLDYWGSNDGTNNGATLNLSNGKVGGAYYFNYDSINLGNSTSLRINSSLTLSAWIYPISNAGWIISKGSSASGLSYRMKLENDNNLSCGVSSDGNTFNPGETFSSSNLELNKWHFVSCVYMPSTYIKVYINGALAGENSSSVVSSIYLSAANASIGSDDYTTISTCFNGSIDEVMIFNRTLSALEIKQLYDGSRYGGNVLGNEYTTVGDSWKVGVLAGDSQFWGSETSSNNIDIIDPITINSAVIGSTNPSANDTSQNLTVSASATNLNNRNITFAYNWYKNDTLNATTLITNKDASGNGLISYWSLNNDTLDYWGSNDGINNGATLNLSGGIVGGGYEFDGSDDYVDVGTDFFGANYNATNTLTIGMWIKPTVINVHQALFDKHTYPSNFGYGVGMWLNNSKIEVEVGNGGGGTGTSRSSTALTANTWYHVAWTANGTSGRIYINGLDSTETDQAMKIYQNAPVAGWIGKAHSTFRYIQPVVPNNFSGSIDEVMIFNRTLSALEIKQLYDGSKYGGKVLGAENTEFGDVWKVGARAGDYLLWSSETNSSELEILNVSINITAIGPQNATIIASQNINFTLNVTDNGGLANATLFIYNETGLYNQTIIYLNGATNAVVGIVVYLVEGIYTWFWQVVDLMNNYLTTQDAGSSIGNYTMTVDLTSTNLSIISPLNQTYSTLQILVNITNSSDAQAVWFFNGSANVTYTAPAYVNFTEGSNIVIAYSNDSAGNLNVTSVVFGADTVYPLISIVYPQNGQNYSYNVTELNYTSSEAGICWHSNNSGISNSTNVNAGANFTNVFGAEGNNDWRLYCNDTAGNLNSSSIIFFQDTINPSLNLSYPVNNSNFTTTNIQINYSASDANLQLCKWTNNSGISNQSITCGANITYSAMQGWTTIFVYVNDSLGNINSSSVNFFVDSVYPVFSNYWDNNATLTTSGTGLFNATINNTNGTVLLEINGVNVTAGNLTANVYNASYAFTSSGTYFYKWRAYGNGSLNNYNSSETRNYTVLSSGVTLYCGDGACNNGETCTTCSADCGSCGGGGCISTGCASADTITCGSAYHDNCGASCGTGTKCSAGESCSGGSCVIFSCSNDCALSGAKQCLGNGYQTCGNYDADSCLEWSSAINCLSDEQCLNGDCVSESCEPDCSGKSCGTDGCGGNCGNCGNGEVCSTNQCVEGEAPDEEDIPVNLPVLTGVAGISGGTFGCTKSFICGEWGKCNVQYDVSTLLSGGVLAGERTRVCIDKNKCFANFMQTEKCQIKEQIEAKKKQWCGQEYTEIISQISGKILARVKQLSNGKSVELNFNAVGEGTCPYCYDGIKNYDEEEIDCGGSCSACGDAKPLKQFSIIGTIYGYLIPFLIFIIFGIMFAYTLRFMMEYNKKSGENSFLRRYNLWKKAGYDVNVLDEDIISINGRK